MIVRVRMSAFNEGWQDIPARQVEIPDEEWNLSSDEQRRELVYHYGQNDIVLVENCRSVSSGDVMEIEGELILVCGIGFEVISEEQYLKLRNMSAQDRQFYVLSRVSS